MRHAAYSSVPENGYYRIQRVVTGTQAEAQAQAMSGEAVVAVPDDVDDERHALDLTPAPIPRPESPVSIDRTSLVADGDDAVTMTDLAEDTRIIVSGPVPDEITVADGTVVWRCLVPGEYRLRIEAPFPHRPAEVVIHGS